MSGDEQYLRKLSLVVGDANGKGLDLGAFKVRFEVKQFELQTPKNLHARVYNLSPEHQNQVQQQFTRVILKAGYEGNSYGTIFDGQIRYFKRGRENNVDSYLDIFAADGEAAYNFAVVNKTLAGALATPRGQVDACLEAMDQFGVTAGTIEGLKTTRDPRGITLNGPAKDYLRAICADSQTSFFIENGKLNIVPLASYLPTDPPIKVNAQTGLIGRAEQTLAGIRVVCLLNPRMRAAIRLDLDNKSINTAGQVAGTPGEAGPQQGGDTLAGQFQPFDRFAGFEYLADVAADGLYRIIYVSHRGDTRETDFYSDVICLGMQDAVPIASVQRGLG